MGVCRGRLCGEGLVRGRRTFRRDRGGGCGGPMVRREGHGRACICRPFHGRGRVHDRDLHGLCHCPYHSGHNGGAGCLGRRSRTLTCRSSSLRSTLRWVLQCPVGHSRSVGGFPIHDGGCGVHVFHGGLEEQRKDDPPGFR